MSKLSTIAAVVAAAAAPTDSWTPPAEQSEPEPEPEPEPELEYGAGCGEHTDYGCLTMVLADDTPGCLQVRAADGSCALPLPSLVGHSAA